MLIQTRVKFSGQRYSCICMGECQTELGLGLWSAGVILEIGGSQQKEQPMRVGRRERFKSGFDSALVFGWAWQSWHRKHHLAYLIWHNTPWHSCGSRQPPSTHISWPPGHKAACWAVCVGLSVPVALLGWGARGPCCSQFLKIWGTR